MSAIFDLNKQVSIEYLCVQNEFMHQLANLAVTSGRELKMLSIRRRNNVSNRGAIQNKGIQTSEKAVLDICRLSSLEDKSVNILLYEVAKHRAKTISQSSGMEISAEFVKRNAMTLFLDYMLSSCLCYVEAFHGTSVEKFFCTRNRFIAALGAGVLPEDTNKYVDHLVTTADDYNSGLLKILKISVTKDTAKLSKPRSSLNVKEKVSITPLFFILTFLRELIPVLQNSIVKISYIKDNIQEREMYTTLSEQILMNYYKDVDVIQKISQNVSTSFYRGYVRLPELGLSRYDETGVRAISVTRITDVAIVNDIDTSYIDVDFNSIMPCFLDGIESMVNDIKVLRVIYMQLMNQGVPDVTPMEIVNILTTWAKTQLAIGTTTFQKYLHKFMLQNTYYFKGYTGLPRTFSGSTSSFNLGVAIREERQFNL